MSKRDTNAKFAFGLVLGLGLAVLFLVWAVPEFRNPEYAVTYYQQQYDQDTKENSQSAFWWWVWNGGLVSSSDTLAQWIMAAVTIIATFVLLLTLRSANKTNIAAVKAAKSAKRTNKLFKLAHEAEMRPWILISADQEGLSFNESIDGRSGIPFGLDVPIYVENIGKSPAFQIHIAIQQIVRGAGELGFAPGFNEFVAYQRSLHPSIDWERIHGHTLLPTQKSRHLIPVNFSQTYRTSDNKNTIYIAFAISLTYIVDKKIFQTASLYRVSRKTAPVFPFHSGEHWGHFTIGEPFDIEDVEILKTPMMSVAV